MKSTESKVYKFYKNEAIGSYFFLMLGLFFLLYENSYSKDFVQIGEELTYEVSYLGITLGEVKMITKGREKFEGNDVVKAVISMDSDDGIPFIDLHVAFHSWIDKSLSHSKKHVGYTKLEDGNWEEFKILLKYDSSKIDIQKRVKKKLIESKIIKTSKRYNDGVSIFFLTRKYCKSGKKYRLPTIRGYDTVTTALNMLGMKENIDLDLVEKPVKSIRIEGKIEGTGVYGLSGEFESWYSDDDARVPLRAEMNVYIGSIDLELIKWKRKNWKPPVK